MKNASLVILIAAAGAATIMLAAAALPTGTASADHHENSTATTAANATLVSVGKGNLTVLYNQFYPQDLQINAGESVTFFNPTPEIHNVVFPLDNTTVSDIILPFSMSTVPQFELLPPYDIGEPWVEPGPNGTQILVTLNKVAFVPSSVDTAGNIQYLNGTDVSYTLTGDEDTLSSGRMFPPEEDLMAMFAELFPEEIAAENMTQTEEPAMAENASGTEEVETFPSINTFTVTFEEPGTYEYFCAFHPAMYGTVTVSSGPTVTDSADNLSAEEDTTSVPPPTSAPMPPVTSTDEESGCDPSYPDVCMASSPDLDCGDVPHKNFRVQSPDPHGFDNDNDGVGCES